MAVHSTDNCLCDSSNWSSVCLGQWHCWWLCDDTEVTQSTCCTHSCCWEHYHSRWPCHLHNGLIQSPLPQACGCPFPLLFWLNNEEDVLFVAPICLYADGCIPKKNASESRDYLPWTRPLTFICKRYSCKIHSEHPIYELKQLFNNDIDLNCKEGNSFEWTHESFIILQQVHRRSDRMAQFSSMPKDMAQAKRDALRWLGLLKAFLSSATAPWLISFDVSFYPMSHW